MCSKISISFRLVYGRYQLKSDYYKAVVTQFMNRNLEFASGCSYQLYFLQLHYSIIQSSRVFRGLSLRSSSFQRLGERERQHLFPAITSFFRLTWLSILSQSTQKIRFTTNQLPRCRKLPSVLLDDSRHFYLKVSKDYDSNRFRFWRLGLQVKPLEFTQVCSRDGLLPIGVLLTRFIPAK